MRACLFFALLVPSLAPAAIYEVSLDNVDDENDVIDLEERGDISTETADILIEMVVNGVDLNSATRDELFDLPGLSYADADAILLYRKNKGRIEEPTELVGAGSITDVQLVLIAPFIRLDAGPVRLPVGGRFRLRSGISSGDFVPGKALPPPGFLTGTFTLPWNLSAGFVVNTTRLAPGTVYYDTIRGLAVDRFAYRASLPTAYLQWKASQRRVVVGSYTIGFAERVTLDNTRRKSPNGISVTSVPLINRDLASACKLSPEATGLDVCNGAGDNYVLDDWSFRTNFRGVAGSIEDLEFGNNRKLSLFGFLSYQSRDLYQYEIFDRERCEDPREDKDYEPCKAPKIYVDGSPDAKLKFTTLPSFFDELVGGAHADFKPSERFRFGLTGYGANTFFGVPSRAPYWHESFASHFTQSAIKPQAQEWSRIPRGGPFGAVGVDAKAQFGQFGLFLEAARTFDSIRAGVNQAGVALPAGGGGYGLEQRTLFNPRGHELELSLRYYDDKFLNPLSRPISAPDELEGQAARNEAGARLRYFGKLPLDFQLRARADLWTLPYTTVEGGAGTTSLYALLRVDYEGYRVLAPAIWFDLHNRNLASSKHGACASGTVVLRVGEEPEICSGDSYKFTARVDLRPLGRKLSGSVQSSFALKDDDRYKDRFMQEVSAAVEVRSLPVEFLQLKFRSRYFNEGLAGREGISDTTYLEQSVWSYFQATYIHSRNFRLSLRYDLNVFLTRPGWVLKRYPNPEHRAYLDLVAGF